jgi:hypothetical protein
MLPLRSVQVKDEHEGLNREALKMKPRSPGQRPVYYTCRLALYLAF